MIWKQMDFQRIANFDHTLVNQLTDFLSQKETRLAGEIFNSIHPIVGDAFAPVLPLSDKVYLKLDDALEAFGKKIRQIPQVPEKILSDRGVQVVIDDINAALWSYLEVLESSETELFQQLKQVGISNWNMALLQVVEEIKDVLMHRMEDLSWAIKRLEKLLREYRSISESQENFGFFKKIFFWWRPVLDKGLYHNLAKSQRYLSQGFLEFANRYSGFQEIDQKTHEALQAIPSYLVLSHLNQDQEAFFSRFSRLLMIWEINQKKKVVPEWETVAAVRNAISPEKAMSFYKHYFEELKNALYEVSRQLKQQQHQDESHRHPRELAQELLLFYRIEVTVLSNSILKYREFLLKSERNPNEGSRLGFSQWAVVPESERTKQLLALAYQTDDLSALYEKLYHSTEEPPLSLAEYSTTEAYAEVQRALNEMSQPLTTQKLMRSYAQRFLDGLEKCDELGSNDPDIVRYVGDVLSKAMRADWKYQVLCENPLFHKLYQVHIGIIGPIEDRSYRNRSAKFKRLLDDIREKVQGTEVGFHLHEIEHDMNDVKAYLQDFLGYVQRVCTGMQANEPQFGSEKRLIKNQLLEYRYLFIDFFYQISDGHQLEGRQLRNQFLFVDQYFESIDNLLDSPIASFRVDTEKDQSYDAPELED